MTKLYAIHTRNETLPVPFDLDGRFLFRSETLELIHLILKSGEVIGMHSQPIPVTFFIFEGEGLLTVEKDVIQASREMMIEVQAGAMRSWRNTGEYPLKMLVIKQLI